MTDLFLRIAIAFLDLAGEFLAITVDLRELIIGQLSPLLFGFTLNLFPVAFDLIPVHDELHFRLTSLVCLNIRCVFKVADRLVDEIDDRKADANHHDKVLSH